MSEHWSAELASMSGLLSWAKGYPTPEAAWPDCHSGEWLLWALAYTGADHRTLVLSACDCARLALPYAWEDDPRPLAAIEMAEAWARGEVSRQDLRDARNDVQHAYRELGLDMWDGDLGTREELRQVRAATEAARYAIDAVRDPWLAHQAAASALQALSSSQRQRRYSRVVGPSEAARAVQREQAELVLGRSFPLLHPEGNAWRRAPEPIQVAWDLLTERMPSEITELGTALQLCSWWTARSLGLDPRDELARAIAQRLQVVPALAEVSAIVGSLG